jgi:uncharacterized RDD family membrane protein YckC
MIFSPWWRRVCASLIDGTIVAVITSVVLLFIGRHPVWDTHKGRSPAEGVAVDYIVVGIAATLYYPLLVWHTNGQTLGKKLLRIRVVRTDLQRMTLAFAAWREVGIKVILPYLLTLLPIIGASFSVLVVSADELWPLWDSENRALHDMLARTRVIRVAKSSGSQRSEPEKGIGGSGLAIEG